ncbi:protein kilB [Streptomyces parvus]|uniref:Protein kilB n=1 Tax=Streptomyces parvus TaxID=66428 RepID=A0A7K3RZP7_9ACTN|nr:protein kilB [Streptomyces parvus]
MLTTLIAVLGTLAGTAIAHLSQRAHRRAADARTQRAEAVTAIADLATALADHRRTMWLREDLRLAGRDWAAARAESHTTRSAITAPLLRVQILLPAVADPARQAAQAVYNLRDAADGPTLTAARDNAIRKADDFVAAAGAALTA